MHFGLADAQLSPTFFYPSVNYVYTHACKWQGRHLEKPGYGCACNMNSLSLCSKFECLLVYYFIQRTQLYSVHRMDCTHWMDNCSLFVLKFFIQCLTSYHVECTLSKHALITELLFFLGAFHIVSEYSMYMNKCAFPKILARGTAITSVLPIGGGGLRC